MGPAWLRNTSEQRLTAGKGGLSAACEGTRALPLPHCTQGWLKKWPAPENVPCLSSSVPWVWDLQQAAPHQEGQHLLPRKLQQLQVLLVTLPNSLSPFLLTHCRPRPSFLPAGPAEAKSEGGRGPGQLPQDPAMLGWEGRDCDFPVTAALRGNGLSKGPRGLPSSLTQSQAGLSNPSSKNSAPPRLLC